MAPEQLSKHDYDYKVDVWALGMSIIIARDLHNRDGGRQTSLFASAPDQGQLLDPAQATA